MKLTKLLKLLFISFLIIFGATVTHTYAQKKLKELVVAIGHTKTAANIASIEKPLQEYLSKKLNMKVRVYYPASISELLDKLETGEIHVADFNPFGYVLASNDKKVDVLVARGKANGEIDTYNSCLIVNAKSDLKNIEDLKKQEGKYHIRFVDALSTSGHLVPRLYLKSQDIQTESFFKEIIFSKSHTNVIDEVSQNIDFVGGCSLQTLQNQIDEGKINKESVRVIWTSANLPHGPVAIQKSLPENLKKELLQAYLTMPEQKELWKIVLENWKSKNAIYVKGNDASFDGLRKITNDDDDLMFILNFYKE
jgi:phosphonate transport system substrate-binding protein